MVREYLRDNRDVPPIDLLGWQQTAGRGRGDHAWSSPGGAGVWASMVRQLDDRSSVQRLPLAVGVGLVRAVEAWDVRCRLKWPNDLVVEGRKLAGILVEGVTIGQRAAAVLGFGLNVTADLSCFNAPKPTSVLAMFDASRAGRSSRPDAADIAVACLESIETAIEETPEALIRAYRQVLVHQKDEVLRCRIGETTVEGRFAGVDDHGRLALETASGRHCLAAAELLDEGKR